MTTAQTSSTSAGSSTLPPLTSQQLSSTQYQTLPTLPVPQYPPPPPPFPSTCHRLDLPHHRLYDFAKTALLKIFVSPYAAVCDFYCNYGDFDKWNDFQIGHYIGVDSLSSSISEVRETWESQRKPYTAHFCELDPSTENLISYLHDKSAPVDIVCCMQHLQLSFESEEKAKRLLNNVASLLKPGGYFLGITPDSSTIWTKYQKNVEAIHSKGIGQKPNATNCIRSESYIVTFETEEEKFPFFGKKYQLKFSNDVTSETHCLVHFPSLIRLAREAGLDYVEIQNFTEFYDDNRPQFAGLLSSYGSNYVDPRGKLLARPFDILGLFAVIVFQKPDSDAIPLCSSPMQPEDHIREEDWPVHVWQHQTTVVEEKNGWFNHKSIPISNEKGILGPGPAELRFSDPL